MLADLFNSLLTLLVLIGMTFWLKRSRIIAASDATTFARLLTDVLLPAVIFASVSQQTITGESLEPAATMLTLSIAMTFLALFVGRLLKLSGGRLGAFILVSAIGSTNSIGWALIADIYPGNQLAEFDAIMIGQLGVLMPLFMISVPLAAWFSQAKDNRSSLWESFRLFLTSPMSIAFLLGLIVSFVDIPDHYLARFVYHLLEVLSDALMVVVAIAIGLLLRPVNIVQYWPAMLAVVVLKLIIEPTLAFTGATLEHLSTLEAHVLLISSAMPSGSIATVVGVRYGCDGAFASAMVVVTFVVGLVTVPLIFSVLG